jgi:Xaa-Pro aminopeptidase
MDIKFLTGEWAVVAAAPVLSLCLVALGAAAVWLVRNCLDNREIAGLRAKVEAMEERLQLAHDKLEEANKARDAAMQFLNQLRSQVTSQASQQTIGTTTSATLQAIMVWSDQINGVAKILEPSPTVTVSPRPSLLWTRLP